MCTESTSAEPKKKIYNKHLYKHQMLPHYLILLINYKNSIQFLCLLFEFSLLENAFSLPFILRDVLFTLINESSNLIR